LLGVGAYSKVCDDIVGGLSGAVTDDGGESSGSGHLHDAQGLGDRANLIEFDEDGITRALGYSSSEARGVGHVEIVADNLHPASLTGREFDPGFPIVLAKCVF